jgi:hypothetical protein
MKSLTLITLLSFAAVVLFSCKKPNAVQPGGSINTKSDTSTALVNNPELIGDWNIVTDTVYLEGTAIYPGASTMYHGTAADHYIFTKYANLYIKSGFNKYTDTAIYNISGTDTLHWINSYFSQVGVVIKGKSQTFPFTITSVSTHSLVLSQAVLTPEGHRFEQITFEK